MFSLKDKLKELEDGFFAVQAEQEAIALNASSPVEASEFLSDECKCFLESSGIESELGFTYDILKIYHTLQYQ